MKSQLNKHAVKLPNQIKNSPPYYLQFQRKGQIKKMNTVAILENLSDEDILIPLAYWNEELKRFMSEKDYSSFEAEQAQKYQAFYSLEIERRLSVYDEIQLLQLAQTQSRLIEQGIIIDYTNIPVKKTYSPTGCLSLLLRFFGVK